MAKSIMIQGTASSVGKSMITAGILHILKQDGYSVCPFKSQNMALNSYVTMEGHEMGRAQVFQAEAAGLVPHCDMNPILLKPTSDKRSQVIIKGKPFKNMNAIEYFTFKHELKDVVMESYNKLASQYDVVVIEGAGSPAEINLKDADIVNMGMAKMADSPVLLVGDIDRGGVFASVYGTMMLLDEEERARVKGVLINKFRGDINILKPGLSKLEELIKVPIIGVVPWYRHSIDDEDSVTETFHRKPQDSAVNIGIVKLPHISNFTDFNVFQNLDGVGVRYITSAEDVKGLDIIILPGSKNTLEDLMHISSIGICEEIINFAKAGGIVFGICGGFQMLGRNLSDPHQTESLLYNVAGMKLLDVDTEFSTEKTTCQTKVKLINSIGILEGLNGILLEGYEIHMGQTRAVGDVNVMLESSDGSSKSGSLVGISNLRGNVFGTYLHGIFDNIEFLIHIVNGIRNTKGLPPIGNITRTYKQMKEEQYDKLADIIRQSIDCNLIKKIIGI